ncbi:phospholipase A [Neisseria zalophi]|uniref:Phospholipase A1 n=1 Tax=Neisseria zalophi TaxID=640030 RepID=A0A5J6Q141_9NEIS|nr:phospholipase A [Neisseria zalophi]QEY26717.1 phospholipase [Neisseria zalophi]
MLKRIFIFGVTAGISLPAFATDGADAQALQCTLIKDNSLRLACFDKIYAAQLPPQAPPVAPVQPSKAVDLVKTVDESLSNKKATVVFSDDKAGVEPSEALLDAADAYTPLSLMYDLDRNDVRGILSVREHNPIYLLPAWYNSTPNYYPESPTRGVTDASRARDQKRLETKMQISFKTKLMEDVFKSRADIWFGYTQTAHWQLWNQGEQSAPFRNNDYTPEVFITQPVKADLPGGGKLRVLGLGLVHQSNGQSRPLSRSWNRIYGMAGMEWGKLTVIPRVWVRAFDQKGEKDDNPDLMKYMGYGDLKVQYRFSDKQTIATTMRYNPKTGKGGIQADYTFPLKGKLKGYIQGVHGYGESLLDYNHKHNSIGFGIMLNDWDGF